MYTIEHRASTTGKPLYDITDMYGEVFLTYDTWQEASDMLEFLNSL